MSVIIRDGDYFLHLLQLGITFFFIIFLFEKSKDESRRRYISLTIIGLVILGSATVFTVGANILRDRAMRDLSSYNTTLDYLNYECEDGFHTLDIRLPVRTNVSLILYNNVAIRNQELLYNITETLNQNHPPTIFIDSKIFNQSKRNISEIIIYPKYWDYPLKFIESFRASISSIPGVSLSSWTETPITRVDSILVKPNGQIVGEIQTKVEPFIPKKDAHRLTTATTLLRLGILMELVFIVFIILFKPEGNELYFLLFFMTWLIFLSCNLYMCIFPISLSKYDANHYYPSCVMWGNRHYLQHRLTDDYWVEGKTLPIANLPSYSSKHPNTIVITFLPGNVLFIGRAGILSNVTYPVAYMGTATPDKVNGTVLLGEVLLSNNNSQEEKITITRPTEINEVIRKINSERFAKFPLDVKLKYTLYINNTNKIYKVYGKLSIDKPFYNITFNDLLRHAVIKEWSINNNLTPIDAIKTGLPEYVVRLVPIGISSYTYK